MTDKCYVAAALFTPAQIRVNNRIAAIVRDVGMEPVLPSELSSVVWKGRAPRDCTPEERREVVTLNIQGMQESGIMIARVSGDTKEVDTGTAWEMGYFFALARIFASAAIVKDELGIESPLYVQRTLIAYIEPSDLAQSLNLMLAETVHAAVYGDAQLHACLSHIRNADGSQDAPYALEQVLAAYAPNKIVMHEREPVGLDSESADKISFENVTGDPSTLTWPEPPDHPVVKQEFDVPAPSDTPGVPAHPSEDQS